MNNDLDQHLQFCENFTEHLSNDPYTYTFLSRRCKTITIFSLNHSNEIKNKHNKRYIRNNGEENWSGMPFEHICDTGANDGSSKFNIFGINLEAWSCPKEHNNPPSTLQNYLWILSMNTVVTFSLMDDDILFKSCPACVLCLVW